MFADGAANEPRTKDEKKRKNRGNFRVFFAMIFKKTIARLKNPSYKLLTQEKNQPYGEKEI